jgi:dTDP-4-dehydrorhamnose 3,5-epimerase
MRVVPAEIAGVILIEPDVHKDERGFFLETYHAKKYRDEGLTSPFLQDNHSLSVRDTLRGLHLQLRKPQGKLVRVIEGEIWDVAVDVRIGSPTFGRWMAAWLSAENFKQLYIPPGCAHGFCVTSARAQVEYKCTALYDPADEVGIAYDDNQLGISWPVDNPVLSKRDRQNPPLVALLDSLAATQQEGKREAAAAMWP